MKKGELSMRNLTFWQRLLLQAVGLATTIVMARRNMRLLAEELVKILEKNDWSR